VLETGGLSVLGTGDADSDGLSDSGEYLTFDGVGGADPLNPDTDGDFLLDGTEIVLGTDPLVHDSDNAAADLNHDGLIDALGAQLNLLNGNQDDDGDGLSNVLELALGTDPRRNGRLSQRPQSNYAGE
jgi:hypothetical protein